MLTGIARGGTPCDVSDSFNPGALTAPGGLLQYYRTGWCTCVSTHWANCNNCEQFVVWGKRRKEDPSVNCMYSHNI